MSVRFLIGRAGSGKTRRIFDEVVARCADDPLGPPIYWLLPKQATFQVERQLAIDSKLPGLCRVLVLSFDQFGEIIRQQCGGIAIPQINSYGRQMIIGHLLRTNQSQLRFFRSVARQPGLAARLDDAFNEFERAGRTAADLKSAGGAAPDPFDPYAAKLHDLSLLFEKYEEYLGQTRLDPHRRMTQVLGCIERWTELKGASVMVDEFLDLAAAERDVLISLARGGATVTISVLLDPAAPTARDPAQIPGDMNLFHRTEQTYRNLWRSFAAADIPVEPPTICRPPAQAFSGTLRTIERDFFSDVSDQMTEANDLCLIEAPDRRAEIDAVARHIGSLLDDGLRLRDIAVLTRDLSPYQELIEESFAEHGIPCFIDRRRSAGHHPLIRFVRLLPFFSKNQWPSDAIIGLCKTGLMGLSAAETDELERYVTDHRIDRDAWIAEEAWNFRVATNRGETEETPRRMEALRRRIVGNLTPFTTAIAGESALDDTVAAMGKLFDELGIAATLSNWMTAEAAAPKREEHQRVWTELNRLLEQMRDLLGPERVSPTEFADILETGLERFDLGVTPPTVDQVLVGAIDRTRTPSIKVAILIGWDDASFPKSPGTNGILSDTDRSELHVGGDRARRLLDEQFLAYFALTRANQALCITRPTGDETGKRLPPSSLWLRMRELFPNVKPAGVLPNDISNIATPRQLTTTLARWVETLEDPAIELATDAPAAAMYQWMIAQPNETPNAVMRDLAWPALGHRNHAALDVDHVAELFRSPMTADVRDLESFAACPFQYFASSVLRLKAASRPQVTGSDMARLYSHVLGGVIGQMIRNKQEWNGPSAQARPLIRANAAAVGRQLRDHIMISTGRNRHMLERAQNELELTVATQEAVAARGDFVPSMVNVKFGREDKAQIPPLTIDSPNEHAVHLKGTIDRVDFASLGNGGLAASAIQYRLSDPSFRLDRVYHGLSLQLLTYLLVLQANGQSLRGQPLTPAAAFYVKTLRGLESIDHPDEATPPSDPQFLFKDKARGLIDIDFVTRFDREFTRKSDVFMVEITKEGAPSGRGNDAVTSHEFGLLLQLVRVRIGEIVDRLITGDISVKPYRINNESPCATCEFRSVCRFDPATERYRHLEPMNRVQVLEAAKEVST